MRVRRLLGASIIAVAVGACAQAGIQPSVERRDRLLDEAAAPPAEALSADALFGADVSRVLVLGPFSEPAEAEKAISPTYSTRTGLWPGGGPGFVVTLGGAESFIAWYPIGLSELDLSCLPGDSIKVRDALFVLDFESSPTTLRIVDVPCDT